MLRAFINMSVRAAHSRARQNARPRTKDWGRKGGKRIKSRSKISCIGCMENITRGLSLNGRSYQYHNSKNSDASSYLAPYPQSLLSSYSFFPHLSHIYNASDLTNFFIYRLCGKIPVRPLLLSSSVLVHFRLAGFSLVASSFFSFYLFFQTSDFTRAPLSSRFFWSYFATSRTLYSSLSFAIPFPFFTSCLAPTSDVSFSKGVNCAHRLLSSSPFLAERTRN